MFIPQRTTVLFDFAAEPVEKPDARLICVKAWDSETPPESQFISFGDANVTFDLE
jgi:hypothetical protein